MNGDVPSLTYSGRPHEQDLRCVMLFFVLGIKDLKYLVISLFLQNTQLWLEYCAFSLLGDSRLRCSRTCRAKNILNLKNKKYTVGVDWSVLNAVWGLLPGQNYDVLYVKSNQ